MKTEKAQSRPSLPPSSSRVEPLPGSGATGQWRRHHRALVARAQASGVEADIAALESMVPPWHGRSHWESRGRYSVFDAVPRCEDDASEGDLITMLLESSDVHDSVLVCLTAADARTLSDRLTVAVRQQEARLSK